MPDNAVYPEDRSMSLFVEYLAVLEDVIRVSLLPWSASCSRDMVIVAESRGRPSFWLQRTVDGQDKKEYEKRRLVWYRERLGERKLNVCV